MKIVRSQPGVYAAGNSLMEVLIAMSISLIVTAAMIALMSVSLSHTGNIIKMTKLTDDLRVSMQMMSRDVRRSNYNANSINCFANYDCIADGSLSSPGDIHIIEDASCFYFGLDRDHDGDSTENAAGGFRWVVANGVGALQTWVGDAFPDCDSANPDWVLLTDPTEIEITGFTVDDALSYSEVIWVDEDGNQASQKVRKIRLNISGRLTADESIQRSISDTVKLRNNLYL